ncbi:Cacna1h [Symbiodinium natans]|uniref:Cacna1h protein n=1 Tax=Symbiodinium natans TaxID=878477 RepID=A0A812NTM0_9DINO|nr:Cacna1h [Symbiodinium natans]
MLDTASQDTLRAIFQEELGKLRRRLLEDTRLELHEALKFANGVSRSPHQATPKSQVGCPATSTCSATKDTCVREASTLRTEVALSDDDDDAGWDLGPAEGNIAGVPVSATGGGVSYGPSARKTSKKSHTSGASDCQRSEASSISRPKGAADTISKVIDEHLQKTRSNPVTNRVQALVRTTAFEMACAMVVVANAVIIGIRADLPDMADATAYDVVELVMALMFLLELVLRVAAAGASYFTAKGGLFNLLDALLIFMMFADAICALANVYMLGIDDGGLMKLYRVARLLRVARMARLFHMVPELHFTLTLMTTSSTSFFWAAVLMLLIMYLVALYFTVVARQFAEATEGVVPELEVFWGTTGKSINSLFLAVFGGQDWHNMLLVFGDGSWWYIVNSIVLSLFVGFALVVLLNLVNGVLVEGAQTMIAERKQHELVRMAADIFVQTGHKAGSELSPEEFDELVNTKAMDNYLEAIGIDPNEARDRLFRFLDLDDSGSLSVVDTAPSGNKFPACTLAKSMRSSDCVMVTGIRPSPRVGM